MTTVEIILLMIGSFGSILITIVAFFSKKTLESITEARLELADVRLELAKLIVSHDATDERSRKNEKMISEVDHKVEDLRRRAHTLEGSQGSLLAYLNTVEEGK